MEGSDLMDKVANYVIRLMGELLSPTLYFHNLSHTIDVVFAVSEIGEKLKLDEPELNVLKIAGWFHDAGYLYKYTGHEDISKAIAANHLSRNDAGNDLIDNVLACINATKMPQIPQNLLQQIICDADFYHFTSKDYRQKARQLRKEWETHLHKFYNDNDWDHLNLTMLQNHQYFTEYAKKVWQPLKMANINQLNAGFHPESMEDNQPYAQTDPLSFSVI